MIFVKVIGAIVLDMLSSFFIFGAIYELTRKDSNTIEFIMAWFLLVASCVLFIAVWL